MIETSLMEELVPFWGDNKYKPHPQSNILVTFRGHF